MASEDYELLPQQVVQDLKYEVEALKKRLQAPDAKINELILEIESLKESIHDLHSVFQQALTDVKSEDNTHQKKVDETASKVDILMQQNETIAKGMIAIADKVDDFVNKQNRLQPNQQQMSNNASFAYQNSQMQQTPSSMGNIGGPQLSMGMPQFEGTRIAPLPHFGELPPLASQGGVADDDDFPPPPPGLASNSKRRGLFK